MEISYGYFYFLKHKWPDEMYGILQSIFLYGSFSQQVVSSYSEPEISTSALIKVFY